MRIAFHARRAFSLIELVIVVLILGIIAAIAVPRMSRGAKGAQDSSLTSNLAVLRGAIDLYNTEQSSWPTVANFVSALTQYGDGQGNFSATKTATCIYGPYLRAIPALPLGTEKGSTTVAAAAAAGVGWIYNETTGVISANTGTLKDDAGKFYTSY